MTSLLHVSASIRKTFDRGVRQSNPTEANSALSALEKGARWQRTLALLKAGGWAYLLLWLAGGTATLKQDFYTMGPLIVP